MQIHRTTVDVVLDMDMLRKRMIEGIVSLYRRSQASEEIGRLFIIKTEDMITNRVEIGLFRTDDNAAVAAAQMFYRNNIHELDENELLQLFMVA